MTPYSRKSLPILKMLPLGGLGEIGLNCLSMEQSNFRFLVDCGVMFPDETMPGVDLVIPDLSYLDAAPPPSAIIITHGHEDHVGAVPYLLTKFSPTVYGTRFTLAVLEQKLQELKINTSSKMIEITPRSKIDLGPFEIEFLRVSHSIPDGVGLAVNTAHGIVVISGDFRMDLSSKREDATDLKRFAELGETGVLALLSDSTNVERDGFSLPESEVGHTLESIILEAKGRVILSVFSSNIARIGQIMEIASRHRRKVALSGKSMVQSINLARNLGVLKYKDELIVALKDISQIPNHRILLLTTGSQGEPLSVLSRLAGRSHPDLRIEPGDTVILSSRFLPGNDRAISSMLNSFLLQGADVVYEKIRNVHASGHAHIEELKLMLRLTKPRYFVPIHGEIRQLVLHGRLAVEMGIDPQNVLNAFDGRSIIFNKGKGSLGESHHTGRIYLDGKGFGDLGSQLIADRRRMSENGLLTCCILYKKRTGKIVGGPILKSCGLIREEEQNELLQGAGEAALEAFNRLQAEKKLHDPGCADEIARELKRYFNRHTNRRPVVIPLLVEV